MRRTRLVWQLYPAQLFIAIAALLAVTWYTTGAVRSFQLRQTGAGLIARARLIEGETTALVTAGDLTALRAFCLAAGRNSATRITVVGPDGLVLADSEGNPDEMENHGARPEVAAAFAGRTDPAIRYSSTSKTTLMYAAIPIVRGGKIRAVLRTAIPVTEIDATLAAITGKIAWGGLAAALIVACLAWLIARRISRPLEAMRQGAENFALGDFSRRIGEEGAEELAALARAMNEMAAELDLRLRTIGSQHAQLQAVFGSMVEGVITVDGQGRLKEINRAGARLLGIDPDQAKGRDLVLAIRNTSLQRLIMDALAGEDPVEGEFVLTDERAREKFFQAHGVELPGQGALLVINEVTSLRQLEKVRRDFVANVSHELKTPITSIEGFAETLQDGALEEAEEAKNFVAIILQQARRLHAIVEDLLSLSRIEQEEAHQQIPLQELPLAETIQAAVQACAGRAADKKTRLAVSCPENLKARLNPALFEQAIINLVDNAIKYSPEGREVAITAESGPDGVRVMVRDQGMGIAVEDQARIFERFYRVDKARSARMGGTGLGLAIVKHIIQAHHGRIRVESSPGQGSVFIIHLPPGL